MNCELRCKLHRRDRIARNQWALLEKYRYPQNHFWFERYGSVHAFFKCHCLLPYLTFLRHLFWPLRKRLRGVFLCISFYHSFVSVCVRGFYQGSENRQFVLSMWCQTYTFACQFHSQKQINQCVLSINCVNW